MKSFFEMSTQEKLDYLSTLYVYDRHNAGGVYDKTTGEPVTQYENGSGYILIDGQKVPTFKLAVLFGSGAWID